MQRKARQEIRAVEKGGTSKKQKNIFKFTDVREKILVIVFLMGGETVL